MSELYKIIKRIDSRVKEIKTLEVFCKSIGNKNDLGVLKIKRIELIEIKNHLLILVKNRNSTN